MSNISLRKTDLPLKIGLTGGIGSGKSMVCRIFRILGVPVFEADQEARSLLNTNADVRLALKAILGDAIFTSNGNVDRKKMAELVFRDSGVLQQVNAVIHPAVRKIFDDWCARQEAPYVLQEAAILYESGGYQAMNLNIVVSAPEELRISRVMARDEVSRKQVVVRIANQWPDEKKLSMADFIIHNNGNEFLVTQVIHIHHKILNYGKLC